MLSVQRGCGLAVFLLLAVLVGAFLIFDSENDFDAFSNEGKQDFRLRQLSPSNTIILGFSDSKYKTIAWRWYQEMEKLGYKEHMVAAMDKDTADFFEEKKMRHALAYTPPQDNPDLTSLDEQCKSDITRTKDDTPFYQDNLYRQSMFGSRWTFVYQKLLEGYNILLTDVDNIFTKYVPLEELEESEFDAYHSYANMRNSHPEHLYNKQGFTICGGMSWLRSTPGVLEFVDNLLQQCQCQLPLSCDCHCDDQIVINEMIYQGPYRIIWDQEVAVPKHDSEISWDGLTGHSWKTGHRVKVWDRHTAFRAALDPDNCPDPAKNWIAMPSNVPDRRKTRELWHLTCRR